MVEQNKNDLTSTIKELMTLNKIEKIPLKEIVLKKQIGAGGQAKVYRGTYKQQEVAVKVLDEVDWKCLAHEIVIISNLHHECIPKFYGIVLEEGIIGLVNKYIEGKPLDEFNIKDIDQNLKFNIAFNLANVLAYIHEFNFIHRDLKPENIMIDNNMKFYLIDFGIAKVLQGNISLTRAKGTVHYMAPETLDVYELNEEEEIVSKITTAVDVWAYGCIVSYLYSEKLPWCNKYSDNQVVLQKVLAKKCEFPVPVDLIITKDNKYKHADDIVKIIKGCTVIDYRQRYTMKDVVGILNEIIKKK